jgi:hypothetical protein
MSAPLLRRRQEAASQERRAGSRLGAVRLQAEHGAQHGASLRCVLSQCALRADLTRSARAGAAESLQQPPSPTISEEVRVAAAAAHQDLQAAAAVVVSAEQRRRSRCLLERARDLHLRGAGQVRRPNKQTSNALSGSSGIVGSRPTAGASRCVCCRAPAAGRGWRRRSESRHVGRCAEDAAGHHRPHAGRGQQPAEQHGARRRVPEGLVPRGQGARVNCAPPRSRPQPALCTATRIALACSWQPWFLATARVARISRPVSTNFCKRAGQGRMDRSWRRGSRGGDLA